MAYDEKVADRMRRILSGRNVVAKTMMGGICYMVDGHMCCGVTGSAIMVRVGREAYRQMLTQPHARPLEFGGRKPTSFVLVDPNGYQTNAALMTWVQRGIDFVATLPAKSLTKRRHLSEQHHAS